MVILRTVLSHTDSECQIHFLSFLRTRVAAADARVVFDEIRPAEVAVELGMSVNAVLLAKSRVLSTLRQEAEGLID